MGLKCTDVAQKKAIERQGICYYFTLVSVLVIHAELYIKILIILHTQRRVSIQPLFLP